MKLERFRVTNFRSVQDSGWVELVSRTVVIGRNESGKSNLLLALRSLKPAGAAPEPLLLSRDFPADRPPSQCLAELPVVETEWRLSEAECVELARLLPEAAVQVSRVRVGRSYEPRRWVSFVGLDSDEEDAPLLEAEAMPAEALEDELEVLSEEETPTPLPESGVAGATHAEWSAVSVASSSDEEKLARDWVLERMPTFLYLDEYPEIEGSLNLADYLRCRAEDRLEPRHEYFEKLLVAAGLQPSDVDSLLSADSATRRRIVSHAGLTITRKLRQLWTDRALKIRFDLDGEQFNTLVADPSDVYDLEINLEQRSRGFRWFFSFFVAFAANANARPENDSVLLLDEPALHLHAVGQRDFLNQLESDWSSQVLLATQSPFLVPTSDLSAVRTVTLTAQDGTRVSNEVAGDAATLVPVVHALGAEIAHSLLDGSQHLVVEDVTDYWYLLAASSLLRESGSAAIPDKLSITPAGKSGTVLHMMGLLGGAGVPSIVLRSDDAQARTDAPDLGVGSNSVYIAEALAEAGRTRADIEDLLDARVYGQLVKIAHSTQLEDRELTLDDSIPQIVKRYEEAFERAGLRFSRSKTARVCVRALLKNSDQILPASTRERFERLFGLIRERFEMLES